MKPDALSIFDTLEDHTNWDKYDQQVDLIEELSDKEQAKGSIRYLRVLLGEDFLRCALDVGNPILPWFFLNSAPIARLSLIGFVDELKGLACAPNFKGLVARLKNSEKAAEALTALDTAYMFSCAGFAVSFDPAIKSTGRIGSGGSKFPDLKLLDVNNNEEIYIEVSRLRKGGHQELMRRIYHCIWQAVHNAILSCPGAWGTD